MPGRERTADRPTGTATASALRDDGCRRPGDPAQPRARWPLRRRRARRRPSQAHACRRRRRRRDFVSPLRAEPAKATAGRAGCDRARRVRARRRHRRREARSGCAGPAARSVGAARFAATIATPVSSQEVSMPRTFTGCADGRGIVKVAYFAGGAMRGESSDQARRHGSTPRTHGTDELGKANERGPA